jgi:transcriptional regulator with XRE-family HTH domain
MTLARNPERFRALRVAAGITQAQVAKAARVSVPAISRFECHGLGLGPVRAEFAAKYLKWKALQ